ncbi:MAG TPA: alanine--tRNA ligase [Chromatiaceae bacterium]|jgi:alanyl-tRNA synthetase|nr:alanine--tRNA ligase [Chromatiaceae bacterium]
MKSSAELRQAFLDFFHERDHEIVSSSPLVPANDPTLLFTNAGMVQFKDVFLGRDKRNFQRATSTQRCVRAGGKHNDLENVGYTARHHTFFEMLGNFSFGDYFKHDAIRYAWEFLTEVMEIPAERLWITVFDEDKEAEDIWLNEIGASAERFSRIGAKDNFWSMGDVGPCGPCTEIFYDHGADIAGGAPGTPEEDGDRYVEIWNLVFMQYDRAADGTLKDLPHPSVDTGMGLERLAAVMQGVHNNYDIDLFQRLIKAGSELSGCNDLSNNSLRVIADHIRSCAFMIVDGVMPSNEGRGYVLRRIIRRAVRHGYQLGITELFFFKLAATLSDEMGAAFPELPAALPQVEQALRQEEERFAETLEQGMKILEQDMAGIKGKEIPGETVFRLYDTFGFPVDLTADVAREKGLTLDMPGFNKAMDAQRERARAANSFASDYATLPTLGGETDFTGYDHLQGNGTVSALFLDGEAVDALQAGQGGVVVLDVTPFYAESGGQVGDTGYLEVGNARFNVVDTQKQGKVFTHMGELLEGEMKVGDTVNAVIDADHRLATIAHHSATHLMHAALREVLGEHVTQKGSLVNERQLRFDFSNPAPMSAEQIEAVEQLVNLQIRLNSPAETKVMDLDEAKESGAMALFGEKYDSKVRVMSIGEFSTELCGGTHVNAAGDIGLFKIVSETGIASGVRRIEAVSGQAAIDWVEGSESRLREVSELLKADRESVTNKVKQLLERTKALEKELDQLKGKLASAAGTDLAGQAVDIDGLKVLAARLDGADPKSLRDTVDQLRNKLGSAAVVLATVVGDKVSLVAGVTKDRTGDLKAGDLVNSVALQVGGKGGGRPDMAQAGGNDPAALDAALASVTDWVRNQLNNV